MNIDWSETICGLSMQQVRDALRRMPDGGNVRNAGKTMKLPQTIALSLISDLEKRGWVMMCSAHRFDTTQDGRSFMIRKNMPPLKRAAATKILERVLAAREAINSNTAYAYDVAGIGVFGSYLSGAPVLSDLEIVYDLEGRWPRNEAGAFVRASDRSNAEFPTRLKGLARVSWPAEVVKRALRVSRHVSLHERSEIDALGWPYKMVVETKRADQ